MDVSLDIPGYLPADAGPCAVGAIASSVSGVFQEGVTLAAPVVTGDPNGDAASPDPAYQWFRNGTAIANANGATYRIPAAGSGVYKVAVTYTDAQDFRSVVESAEKVISKINNGNGVIGSITSLSAGAFNEGVTLVAGSIADDPDGNGSIAAYQWLRNGSPIGGATKPTFATNALIGAGSYSVQATYADAQGFNATITSAIKTVAAIDNGQGAAGASPQEAMPPSTKE